MCYNIKCYRLWFVVKRFLRQATAYSRTELETLTRIEVAIYDLKANKPVVAIQIPSLGESIKLYTQRTRWKDMQNSKLALRYLNNVYKIIMTLYCVTIHKQILLHTNGTRFYFPSVLFSLRVVYRAHCYQVLYENIFIFSLICTFINFFICTLNSYSKTFTSCNHEGIYDKNNLKKATAAFLFSNVKIIKIQPTSPGRTLIFCVVRHTHFQMPRTDASSGSGIMTFTSRAAAMRQRGDALNLFSPTSSSLVPYTLNTRTRIPIYILYSTQRLVCVHSPPCAEIRVRRHAYEDVKKENLSDIGRDDSISSIECPSSKFTVARVWDECRYTSSGFSCFCFVTYWVVAITCIRDLWMKDVILWLACA